MFWFNIQILSAQCVLASLPTGISHFVRGRTFNMFTTSFLTALMESVTEKKCLFLRVEERIDRVEEKRRETPQKEKEKKNEGDPKKNAESAKK